MNRVPTRIDLTPYDEKAVKTFVDYVHSDDQSNLKLSFYALADLIDLARSLLVPGLLKQLEDVRFFLFLIARNFRLDLLTF